MAELPQLANAEFAAAAAQVAASLAQATQASVMKNVNGGWTIFNHNVLNWDDFIENREAGKVIRPVVPALTKEMMEAAIVNIPHIDNSGQHQRYMAEWMAIIATLKMVWHRVIVDKKTNEVIDPMATIIGNDNPYNAARFGLYGDFPAALVDSIGMVYHVLRKVCRGSRVRIEAWDDCLQAGLLALCKAYALHDKAKGEFAPFAFCLVFQGVRNEIKMKNQPLYVMGDGKRTIRELATEKMDSGKKEFTRRMNRIRYNPETIDNRQLKSEGFENIDGIPYKGQMVFIRFDESSPMELLTAPQLEELGDSWNSKCEASIKSAQTQRIQRVMAGLTEREKEVLALHKQGYTDVEIARMVKLTKKEIAAGKTKISKAAVGQNRKKAVAWLDVVMNDKPAEAHAE
jgi:RNA polymerase sigma factor (sigma-70 family)